MKIFNTLTRSKEEFKPIEEGRLRFTPAALPFTILSISATQGRSAFLTFFAAFLNISAMM